MHYGAPVTETTESDPVSGFAALMAQARPAPEPDGDPAPYGYTVDEKTGGQRPKKAPGRPRKSPSLEDLKAQRAAESPVPGAPVEEDRPPAALKGRRRRREEGRTDRPAPPIPQKYRAEGSIAKGINQLYRKAGKIIKGLGAADVGQAFIEITRSDDPEDFTVGDAWEALARSNPRIRAFWLRALSGGAWSQVLAAHLPVFAALLMIEGIRKRIPFGGLAMAFVDDSEDGEAPAAGTPFEGLRPEDVAQMQAMAQAMAERVMGGGVPDRGEALS